MWHYYFDRVVVIDKVTDFLLFISKLVVVAFAGKYHGVHYSLMSLKRMNLIIQFSLLIFSFFVSAASSYFFFDGRIEFLASFTPSLNFYVVPIVVSTFCLKFFFTIRALSVCKLKALPVSHYSWITYGFMASLYIFSWSHWAPMS